MSARFRPSVLTPAAVVLLLAVAAFGLAGRDRVRLSFEPIPAATLGGILAVVVACTAWVLAATLVLARSSVTGALQPAFRRALLINLGLLVLAAGLLSGTSFAGFGDGAQQPGAAVIDTDGWNGWVDMGWFRYVALALVVALALAGALLFGVGGWSLRRRFYRDRTGVIRERPLGRRRRGSASPEELRDALVRARRALQTDEDTRRAIISAYAAMEEAVAAHGLEREPTLTPAEFIGRGLTDRLIRDEPAARRLLGLFGLARFSHEPLPPDAVSVADASLSALLADLDLVEAQR